MVYEKALNWQKCLRQKLLMYFLNDHIIQFFFEIADPIGEILFHNFPGIALLLLHFEDDAITSIVGHIYMKKTV
jgi:hypothetical protein